MRSPLTSLAFAFGLCLGSTSAVNAQANDGLRFEKLQPDSYMVELISELNINSAARKLAIKRYPRKNVVVPFEGSVGRQVTCNDPKYPRLLGYRLFHEIALVSTILQEKTRTNSTWNLWIFNKTKYPSISIDLEFVCAAPRKSSIKPNYYVRSAFTEEYTLEAQRTLGNVPRKHDCLAEGSEVLAIEPLGKDRDMHYLGRRIVYENGDSEMWIDRMKNMHGRSQVRHFHSISFKYYCGLKIQ